MRAVLLLSLLTLISCQHSVTPGAGWPDDAVLTTTFERERRAFDELLELSNADTKIWRIAPDHAKVEDAPKTPPRAATSQDLPTERWDRYRALFKKLGLPQGLTRERLKDGEAVLLPFFSVQAGAVDSVEKGILHTTAKVTDLANDLTLDNATKAKPNAIHKHLRDGWYLYARYNE